ncbi:MAG: enoyl-CoA hydratase-related protein, partial [Pseudomonadota bacterium]
MDFQDYQTLKFEREGRLLRVIISSGPMNAVNEKLHEELATVFEDVQRDPDSDVIVLTGEGRAFCAGGDMTWFQEMIDDPARFQAIAHDAKRIVFSLL